VTNASAASAPPVDSPRLALLGAATEAKLQGALARFQASIQDWLDSPLDDERVFEWTCHRAAG
jgi:hypothetical protein